MVTTPRLHLKLNELSKRFGTLRNETDALSADIASHALILAAVLLFSALVSPWTISLTVLPLVLLLSIHRSARQLSSRPERNHAFLIVICCLVDALSSGALGLCTYLALLPRLHSAGLAKTSLAGAIVCIAAGQFLALPGLDITVLAYPALVCGFAFGSDRLARPRHVGLASVELTSADTVTALKTAIHDISNPLTLILGAAQLAVNVDDPEKLRVFWPKVRTAGEKIHILNSNLRGLVYLNSGQGITLQSAPVDIPKLLPTFSDLAQFFEVELDLSGCTHAPLVRADHRLLDQLVLGQLIYNALRFAPAHSKVTVKTGATAETYSVTVRNSLRPQPVAIPNCLLQPARQFEEQWPSYLEDSFGLTLSRRICLGWGGDLSAEISGSSLKQYVVELRLPI